jgi:Zn-dependent protease with chaperone function
MVETCIHCLVQVNTILRCTSSCLTSANISPAYPGSILLSSAALSIAFFLLAIVFRNDLKKVIGFRIASIAFFSTALFTIGLIFNGHFVLKNLPFVIPAIGVGSYAISYFLSFYLIRISYRSVKLENKNLQNFVSNFSKQLKVKKPELYSFFSLEPKAFVVDGFKKAIFISESLMQKLDLFSIKAVLMHEIYHLKRRSGMLRNILSSLGNLGFRILPVPIKELERYEEEEIDKILLQQHKINMDKIKRKLWS